MPCLKFNGIKFAKELKLCQVEKLYNTLNTQETWSAVKLLCGNITNNYMWKTKGQCYNKMKGTRTYFLEI